VYSHLLGTLRSHFLSTDLTAKAQSPIAETHHEQSTASDPEQIRQHRDQLSSWARGEDPPETKSLERNDQQDLRLDFAKRSTRTPEFRPFGSPADSAMSPREDDTASQDRDAFQDSRVSHVSHPPAGLRAPLGLQLHNRYLVTENDEGMVVIDQHALHERIIYEQLREKVLAGSMETQRLLVPEPVSLNAPEAAAVLDARETLMQLGIEAEPFGGDTVLISAYPAMLANMSPGEVLRQVVELLLAENRPPDRRDLLDELLHMISCKAAIKAGDRLSPEEIQALLEQRDLYQDTHHCPHGRPTALVFTREELDKRFGRI
jgi:DNA mismatch repair protein MutL